MVRLLPQFFDFDSEVKCKILEFDDCQLPIRPGEWYRRTAKELNAPYFLRNDEKISANILDSENKLVKEIDISGSKGLNFVTWNLLLNEDETVEPGTYTLQLKGSGIEESREFEVKTVQRRRR